LSSTFVPFVRLTFLCFVNKVRLIAGYGGISPS